MNLSSGDLIQQYVVCPKCRAELGIENQRYTCTACGHQTNLQDGVFLAKPLAAGHYFDSRYQAMQRCNELPEIWELCYAQQSRLALELIRPGDVVVDIGCGPVIHFKKPQDCVLIGVDPSFASIRVNEALDVRVFSSADAIPPRNRSVDRVFFAIPFIT